jgi:hypothetical protein
MKFPKNRWTAIVHNFVIDRGSGNYLLELALLVIEFKVEGPAMHVYEVRPRKDHRGVDLISDAVPFGRLWYGEPDAISNAIGYAKFYSRIT